MKRSLVDPWKHRSANLTMEGYPPRDWSLPEHQLTLPRTHCGCFNKSRVIFILSFSIILLILTLTSCILLHTNDRKFCQHDHLISAFKINSRQIRLKMLKRFCCEARLLQLSELCV